MPEDWPADVPEVWIKIIHKKKPNSYDDSAVAIIMKNENKPRKPGDINYDFALNGWCDHDHCKSFKQNAQALSKFSHLMEKIRCCPFNKKINALFKIYPMHEEENTLLQIDNLTNQGY